ncbi:uncharacterized protein LOC120330096 [Styela clava]
MENNYYDYNGFGSDHKHDFDYADITTTPSYFEEDTTSHDAVTYVPKFTSNRFLDVGEFNIKSGSNYGEQMGNTSGNDINYVSNITSSAPHAVFSHELHLQWVLSEIFSYTLLFLNCYVVFCFIVYHIRKRGTATRNSYFFSKKSGALYSMALNTLTILSAVITAVRVLLNLDTIWGRSSEMACLHLKKPKIFVGFLVYLTVYMSFWVRQRIFYSSPQLNHLSNKATRFLSKWILLVLVLGYLANLVYFMVEGDSHYKPLPPNGCSVSSDAIPWYLLAANTVIMQFTLLALLTYPMLKRNKARQGGEPNNRLIRLVRKVLMAAIFAVVCCISSLFIILFISTPIDEKSLFIVDVNLTILVFTVVIMFSDWRVRLFPFRKKFRGKSNKKSGIN